MFEMWISYGEGFILLFDINDKESFDILESKYNRILKGKHGIEVPIVLVGNRKDLEGERKVSSNEAARLAYSWGIEYIEANTKNNLNCKESFEILSKEILLFKKGKIKEYRKMIKKKGIKINKNINENNLNKIALFKFINY